MESFVKGTGICPRPNNLSLGYVIHMHWSLALQQ